MEFGWWEGGGRLIQVEGCRGAHSNAVLTSTVPAFQSSQGCCFPDDDEEGSDGDEDDDNSDDSLLVLNECVSLVPGTVISTLPWVMSLLITSALRYGHSYLCLRDGNTGTDGPSNSRYEGLLKCGIFIFLFQCKKKSTELKLVC